MRPACLAYRPCDFDDDMTVAEIEAKNLFQTIPINMYIFSFNPTEFSTLSHLAEGHAASPPTRTVPPLDISAWHQNPPKLELNPVIL